MTLRSPEGEAPRVILLDIGMTLIHPSASVMVEELRRAGAAHQITTGDAAMALAAAAEAHHLDFPRNLGRQEKVGRFWGALLGVGPDVGAEAWAACTARPDLYGELDHEAHQLLNGLSQLGIRLGAVSNSDHGTLPEELLSFGLLDYFAAIVDSKLVGCEKPAPAIYHEALDLLECDAEHAWFLGDGVVNDVLGSLAAGLGRAVLYDPYGLHSKLPVIRLRTLVDLLDLIPCRRTHSVVEGPCASA